MRQQPLPQRRQLHRLRGQLRLQLPHGLQRRPLREQHARLHGQVPGARAGHGPHAAPAHLCTQQVSAWGRHSVPAGDTIPPARAIVHSPLWIRSRSPVVYPQELLFLLPSARDLVTGVCPYLPWLPGSSAWNVTLVPGF